MNIQEMHETFRVLGQQMGMQLNRGILPGSIDIYLNDAISEKTHTELVNGVRTALQDGVNTQAAAMNPINAFRTLYRTARYKIDTTKVNSATEKVSYYNGDNGFHIINIPTVNNTDIKIEASEFRINPMMYLGFSVEYPNVLRGNSVACRLIGSDNLETTLRDYCNGASKDSPIVCLASVPVIDDNQEKMGAISSEQLEIYTNNKGCKVTYLNIKYVKAPNVVKYDVDLNNCINCDLPAYTHFEIVERAVQKFYASVGATSSQSSSRQRDDN